MSLLSNLFKSSKKQNLTPDVPMPTQESLYFTPSLRSLVDKRLGGQDLGFGEDYTSKTSNPAIAQLENSFQKSTVPFISSQLSKRGVARSAGKGLATDIMGQAEHQKNLDVNELISKFFNLNEMQKKQDFGQALQLGENMQNQQANMKTNQASASERLANATASNAQQRESADTGKAGNLMAAAGSLLGGPVGASLGSLTSSLRQTPGNSNGLFQTGNNLKTKTLDSLDDNSVGSMSNEQIMQLLAQLFQ